MTLHRNPSNQTLNPLHSRQQKNRNVRQLMPGVLMARHQYRSTRIVAAGQAGSLTALPVHTSSCARSQDLCRYPANPGDTPGSLSTSARIFGIRSVRSVPQRSSTGPSSPSSGEADFESGYCWRVSSTYLSSLRTGRIFG
jgi:hypothetical protein